MKNYFFTVFLFLSCFAMAQNPGEWTWMHGDSLPNSNGVYGIQGVPSVNNMPPALYEACEWTDLDGNFWLFGGGRFNNYGVDFYSDLWKFNVSTKEWTWVHGIGYPNISSWYGIQGVPSVYNNPGGRTYSSLTWTDLNGNLWLFGGLDCGTGMELGDLWKYEIASNSWTWMNGCDYALCYGNYGIQGIGAPSNMPPGRCESSCSWVDNNNNLWMFGGTNSYDLTIQTLSDLWKYDINTNEWTWMNGSNLANQTAGAYGVQGVESYSNRPGARNAYTRWKDKNGNLWFFGGGYIDPDGSDIYYNDVWKYNLSTNKWTWMFGSNTSNNPGNPGTNCSSSQLNLPSSRIESRACWADDCGHAYLFGGFNSNSMGIISNYNDLWKLNYNTGKWTLLNGNTNPDILGIYGQKGISNPNNHPGSRGGALSWMDNYGNLWLFGGGFFSDSTILFNDLWCYKPDPNCPIELNTASLPNLGNDTTVCANNYELQIHGGNSYLWSTGDTTSSINVETSGMYSVSVTGICVSGTDSIHVSLIAPPLLFLGHDTTLCANSLQLNAGNPGYSYHWSTGENTQEINVSTSGDYWVSISNGLCSNISDTIHIAISSPPYVFLGNDTIISEGATISLNASNPGCSFSWSTGDTTQSIIVNSPGSYSVTVNNGNCSWNDEIHIYFPSIINVPNVFTPNEDGLNDVFIIQGKEIEHFECSIFNRWGKKVYEWHDISKGWDGTSDNSTMLSEGVYYYIISATGKDKKKYELNGSVTLIR